MRRFSVFMATLLMASVLAAGSADAGHEWCAEDPVFQVLGANFRVTTSVNAPASAVTGITYDVTLPAEAQGATAVHYPQGRRLPTTVNISYSGTSSGASFPVTVRVTVSTATPAAVVVSVTGPDVTAQSATDSSSGTTELAFNATAK